MRALGAMVIHACLVEANPKQKPQLAPSNKMEKNTF
jgi:hypothetical protein